MNATPTEWAPLRITSQSISLATDCSHAQSIAGRTAFVETVIGTSMRNKQTGCPISGSKSRRDYGRKSSQDAILFWS